MNQIAMGVVESKETWKKTEAAWNGGLLGDL